MEQILQYQAKVITGKGRGRRIGVATLNLEIPADFQYEYGIYAGFVISGRKKEPTVFHYGPVPTFKEMEPTLEAHVLDREIIEPPEMMTFELVRYLRPVAVFNSARELMAQVAIDILDAKKYLL